MFAPTLLCVLLAYFPFSIIVYVALGTGVVAYLGTVGRRSHVGTRAVLWSMAVLLFPICLTLLSTHDVEVWNIAAGIYLLFLLVLYSVHVLSFSDRNRTRGSIFWVAVMQAVFLYSYVFNLATWLHTKGFGPEFFYPYQKWIPYLTNCPLRYYCLRLASFVQ